MAGFKLVLASVHAEDGPLADLGHIWGVYVEGFDLEDYTAVAKGTDAAKSLGSGLVGVNVTWSSGPHGGASLDEMLAGFPGLAQRLAWSAGQLRRGRPPAGGSVGGGSTASMGHEEPLGKLSPFAAPAAVAATGR